MAFLSAVINTTEMVGLRKSRRSDSLSQQEVNIQNTLTAP